MCVALASEAVNVLDIGRSGNMALKINIRKAFDTLSWHFLQEVLLRMQFSQTFITMVRCILESAS